MRQDNIILTGFMGTGKTAVGRTLAAKLNRPFVDTDDLIAERDGRSIDAIFREDGEARFRAWERQIAQELATREGLVIATGGRLMLDEANAALLGATGPVFCLTAQPDVIVARLTNSPTPRPLLAGVDPAERVKQLLQQREAGYARFRQVDTKGRRPATVAEEIAESLANGFRQRLPVRYPGGDYDILVGRDLLPDVVMLAGVAGTVALVTDDHVGPLYAPRIAGAATVITIMAGEQHKHLATVRVIYDRLLAAGIDRQGAVAALGGGVVGDVGGFAAATYLRGIELVQCPTTLLAMVDASIGGKTGVDLPQGKNLVGAFKHPRLVVADIDTLATLPAAEFTAGLAEVAKHGLIADPVLWQRLLMEDWDFDPACIAEDRLLRDSLQALVVQAIRVKRDIVEEDPYETGRRAVLNLGHTFAHAIEQASRYGIRHGDAVAMGLAAAAHLSAALDECPSSLPGVVEMVLTRLGLPAHVPPDLTPEALYAAMGSDKKKQDGRLRFVLLRDVGDVFVRPDVPEAALLDTLAAVRA